MLNTPTLGQFSCTVNISILSSSTHIHNTTKFIYLFLATHTDSVYVYKYIYIFIISTLYISSDALQILSPFHVNYALFYMQSFHKPHKKEKN